MRIRDAATALLTFSVGCLLACRPAVEQAVNDLAPDRLRLVTLSPHLAELVFAAGADEFLVGVSAYSDYPEEAAGLPVVGDAFAVDLERLALLQPTVLLAWQSGTAQHVVDDLAKRGYRVVTIRTRSLEDVALALETIGRISGRVATASQAAATFREALDALAEQYVDSEPIRVFYQIQKRPLYTINGDHYVSELIGLCGGQNVFADLISLAPLVAVEAVIERNPEVMLVSSDTEADAFGEWDRWPKLAANRYGNRFVMPADEIGRPTPRLLIAGRSLCETLKRGRENRQRLAIDD